MLNRNKKKKMTPNTDLLGAMLGNNRKKKKNCSKY